MNLARHCVLGMSRGNILGYLLPYRHVDGDADTVRPVICIRPDDPTLYLPIFSTVARLQAWSDLGHMTYDHWLPVGDVAGLCKVALRIGRDAGRECLIMVDPRCEDEIGVEYALLDPAAPSGRAADRN